MPFDSITSLKGAIFVTRWKSSWTSFGLGKANEWTVKYQTLTGSDQQNASPCLIVGGHMTLSQTTGKILKGAETIK